MPSENARAVAKEVIESVRKGSKVSIRKIARKHGYAQSVADHAKKITGTKTYQETIAPIVQAMIEERDAALEEARKKRNKAHYRDLIDASAKLTKDIQLLSGGKTSNDEVKITWEK